jgi:hypothetical protein
MSNPETNTPKQKTPSHKQPIWMRAFNHLTIEHPEGCWICNKKIDPAGYGRLRIGNKSDYLHRVMYELFIGKIPEGKELDHLCRNRACANPFHLEAVTHKENNNRGVWPNGKHGGSNKKTHCLRGHPLSGENLSIRPDGTRRCKACGRFYYYKYYSPVSSNK